MSALRDEVILGLFDAAVDDLAPDATDPLREHVALVAHGGYGRGETAPYSDVDLMILHDAASADAVAPLARRLMHDVFDAGLALGHSVRTPREACRLAMRDAVIGTSLMESRLLAGSAALFAGVHRGVGPPDRPATRAPCGGHPEESDRRAAPLRRDRLSAGAERQAVAGRPARPATAALDRPDTLRPQCRWLRRARRLCERGELSKADADALGRATEFLLRLRNELHFHAGRAHDVLDRAEQVRIAERFGYRGTSGMMPVESFMRDYFRHTEAVSHVVTRFAEKALAERGFGWAVDSVVSHRVGNDYRVGPSEIRATRAGLGQLRRDLVAVLQLAELANLYDKRIAPETWDVIRRAAPGLVGPITPEARSRFLSLLNHPARLGELLRGLHEVGAARTVRSRPAPRPGTVAVQPVPQVHGRRALPPRGRTGDRAGVRHRAARPGVPSGATEGSPAPGPVDSRPGQGLSRRPLRDRAANRRRDRRPLGPFARRRRDAASSWFTSIWR